MRAFHALETDECYVYVAPAADEAPAEASALARDVAVHAPGALLSLLEPIVSLRGASDGIDAAFHYVVETDVLPEQEADFNRWYDLEHLPGLAAVPGTACASRFRNPRGSPRYHACYDIESPSTIGSAPWLAVRGTTWSQRVRPAFRNTKRTMMRRLAP